ncbi:MAG: hypothetical protein VCB25_10390 [Myxococcota bacterium]
MSKFFWLIALLLLAPGLAVADATEMQFKEGHVRLRVGLLPSAEVIVGQQTRFFVEILTDTWFTKAPAYPELLLEGAIALLPEQLGSNFTERIDGETFAGQRRRYLIFPQRTGPLKIPSLQIRLGVSEDGRPGQPFTLQTPPLQLNVVLPAAAAGIKGLVTTPRLRIEDVWNHSLEDLQVGDAVERRIQLNAQQALGMLLPDLEFRTPTGIAAYADQPHVRDEINRGQYRGERIEAVTYVMQQSGEFTLPAIEVHWWNSVQQRLEIEKLEARTFVVAARVGQEVVASSTGVGTSWRMSTDRILAYLWAHRLALVLVMFSAVVGAIALRRLWPCVIQRAKAITVRRRNSETFFFRVLMRSVRGREAKTIVQDYWRWRDRLAIEAPPVAREDWRRAETTSGLAEPWSDFERERYGLSGTSRSRIDLRAPLRAFRAEILAMSKQKAHHRRRRAGLNPAG